MFWTCKQHVHRFKSFIAAVRCIVLLLLASPVAPESVVCHPGHAWKHILKKTFSTLESFSLPSPSLNSFKTALSHQSLLYTCIQNLCVVHGDINPGSLLIIAAKRVPCRQLFCKSWKRVSKREHNWRNVIHL